MSVPLDRLYDYLESVAEEIVGDRTVIYRFYPHGSKKLDDLQPLHFLWPPQDYDLLPVMYCHDQEPLFWDLYQQQDSEFNLRKKSRRHHFDQCLLLHSEQRSMNLEKYRTAGFVPVYYWSHAVIARDWYRFAEHVRQRKRVDHCFLMYNRAWGGTREYRLKLVEKIIQHDLANHVLTTVNPVEPESALHYANHVFANDRFRPQLELEKWFGASTASSASSADFEIDDYESTRVEVVLETLFDDDRLHLTEKIFRPIALGQPFVLAGTTGSLDYLRSYGFRTFDKVWNEDYDFIADPIQRLDAIVSCMKQISSWSPHEAKLNQHTLDQITQHNRQLFFSKEFSDYVMREFVSNFKSARNQVMVTSTGQRLARYVNTI